MCVSRLTFKVSYLKYFKAVSLLSDFMIILAARLCNLSNLSEFTVPQQFQTVSQ